MPAVPAEAVLTEKTRSGLLVNARLEQHPLEQQIDVVYRYAMRLIGDEHEASDLVQETMLRGWRWRYRLRDPAAMRVWLLRIATNLHRDQLRKKTETPRLLVESSLSRERPAAGRLIQKENVAQALAALDRLPTRQRQVMHLVTVEGLSQEATAEVLEISTRAVKASLSMARKQLRVQLKELYDEVCGKKRCPSE